MIQLQPNSDRPDLLQLQRRLLPSSLPLFHGVTRTAVFETVFVTRSFVEKRSVIVDAGRRALIDPEGHRVIRDPDIQPPLNFEVFSY